MMSNEVGPTNWSIYKSRGFKISMGQIACFPCCQTLDTTQFSMTSMSIWVRK